MEDKKYQKLEEELTSLRLQLEEATDTIYAIRSGQVDALIINDKDQGHQLYTLRSVDQTYRIFIEKMSEGAVTLNKDGIILYSNSSFANKIGVGLKKIIGVPFIDLVTQEDKNLFNELLNLSWTREIKSELSLATKKGTMISFLLSFASLELEEGTCISIILTDLSDQKATELKLKANNIALEEATENLEKANNDLELTVKERTRELQLSQDYFKMLANSMPQMCWTNDRYGDIDFFNERWYEYTGLNLAKAKKLGWAAYLHPDDLDQTIKMYNTSLEKGKVFTFENRYKRQMAPIAGNLTEGSRLKMIMARYLCGYAPLQILMISGWQWKRKMNLLALPAMSLKHH
ncbi:PAS domain S-box protein [bacterium]|nr:MAG: PAS domain S-box protein [bacterium]